MAVSNLVMAVAISTMPVSDDARAADVSLTAVSDLADPAQTAGRTEVRADDQGAIIVTGHGKPPPGDPLQNVNIQSFEVVQAADKVVVGPVAHVYAKGLPAPLRSGVHNVLRELEEPTVFINFVLQHRIGKAAETAARFAINATLGLGGLIDVAKTKSFGLPHRINGFGYTLGFYGVGSGPYLYLPLIGSTTLRDVTGRMLDLAVLPTAIGAPFKGIAWTVGYGTLRSIDDRVAMDALIDRLRDNDPDPYVSMKKYYMQQRKAEIDALHGPNTGLAEQWLPPAN